MTADEIKIARALYHCSMLPGTFDKRFISNMHSNSKEQNPKPLSDKQNEILFRLCYKYRAQIPNTYNEYKNNVNCCKK